MRCTSTHESATQHERGWCAAPPALTIAAQGSTGNVTADITDRVIDTLLGGAIALAVLLGSLALRHLGGDRWREREES